MDRECSINGGEEDFIRILVGKPEGKVPLGRPRRRWVDNNKMYFREVGWDGMTWRLVEDSYEHGNEPSGSMKCWKFLSSCTTGSFSRRAQLHGVSYFYFLIDS
jgi:hypothetical protein